MAVQRQSAIYQVNYMNQMKYNQHTTNKIILTPMRCEKGVPKREKMEIRKKGKIAM